MSLNAIKAGRAGVEIFGDNSRLVRSLRNSERRLNAFSAKTARVGATLFGAGVAAASPFAATLSSASKVEETMNKFRVVFGERSDEVKAWGDSFANQVGRAENEIADFLAGSQDLFVPLGFEAGAAENLSKQITALGVDLASFNNKADADVMRDLHAALTGSGEVMKKYGVIVSEAAVKQELLNQGLDPQTATNQMKVQARLNIIMAGTTAAQGDAIRSAGSYANMQKRLNGEIFNTSAAMGKSLLPTASAVFEKFSQGASIVRKYVDEHPGLIGAGAFAAGSLLAGGAALLSVAAAAKLAALGIGVVATVVVTVGTATTFALSPLGLLTAGVVLLGSEAERRFGLIDRASKTLGTAFATLKTDATTAFSGITDALSAGDLGLAARIGWSFVQLEWERGTAALDGIVNGWADGFLNAWSETIGGAQIIALEGWNRIKRTLRDGLGGAMDLLVLFKARFTGDGLDKFNAVQKVLGNFQERQRQNKADQTATADAADLIGSRVRDEFDQRTKDRIEREKKASQRIEEAQRKLAFQRETAKTKAEHEAAKKAAREKAQGDTPGTETGTDTPASSKAFDLLKGTSRSGVASQLAFTLAVGKKPDSRVQKETDEIDAQTAALSRNTQAWIARRAARIDRLNQSRQERDQHKQELATAYVTRREARGLTVAPPSAPVAIPAAQRVASVAAIGPATLNSKEVLARLDGIRDAILDTALEVQ